MCRLVAVALVSLLAIVLGTGCGEEGSSIQGPSPESSPAGRESVADLLMSKADLPPGYRAEDENLTTSCDPLEELKTADSEAAKSLMFAFGEARVQEAVGVFADK